MLFRLTPDGTLVLPPRGAHWPDVDGPPLTWAALRALVEAAVGVDRPWRGLFLEAGRTQLALFGPALVREVPRLAGGAWIDLPDTLGHLLRHQGLARVVGV